MRLQKGISPYKMCTTSRDSSSRDLPRDIWNLSLQTCELENSTEQVAYKSYICHLYWTILDSEYMKLYFLYMCLKSQK